MNLPWRRGKHYKANIIYDSTGNPVVVVTDDNVDEIADMIVKAANKNYVSPSTRTKSDSTGVNDGW